MKKTKLNKLFDKQFGLYVKQKRIEKGWSQIELASRVENNFQNISRLERGEVTPTLFWCYKLANAFEMDLSEIIKEFAFDLKVKK
ncbi:MAG: helix-turn-helix transcriptional regulator [Bacteroidetes bacterium]|nr:helix-turn-helix transcriptional regulator [Bacteroidota bacterium]